MAIKNEGVHSGEGVFTLANGTRSLNEVTIVSGQNLGAMAVVGKVTASGKYAVYNNGAADGTETAAGVLLAAVDASAADKQGVIIDRDAEIRESALQFDSGQGAPDIAAGKVDLEALGIRIRSGV